MEQAVSTESVAEVRPSGNVIGHPPGGAVATEEHGDKSKEHQFVKTMFEMVWRPGHNDITGSALTQMNLRTATITKRAPDQQHPSRKCKQILVGG